MIYKAYYESEFGFIKISYTPEYVVELKIVREEEGADKKSGLSDDVFRQISEYFNGIRKTFDFPIKLTGTEFQKKVWDELLRIPYGETRTYKQIAANCGNAGSWRAVGMANNNNPIMIAVPCHRVIGSDGSLTGYAGGLDMKRKLLELEQKAMVE